MYFNTVVIALAFVGATIAAPIEVRNTSMERRQVGKAIGGAIIQGGIDWGKGKLEEAMGDAMYPDKGDDQGEIPELEVDPSWGELNDMNFKSWNPSVHGDN